MKTIFVYRAYNLIYFKPLAATYLHIELLKSLHANERIY